MNGLKAVLSDKKVWVALVGLVAGIAVALGFNESLVATISGGVLSVVSVVLMALMGVKTAKSTATQPEQPAEEPAPSLPDVTDENKEQG